MKRLQILEYRMSFGEENGIIKIHGIIRTLSSKGVTNSIKCLFYSLPGQIRSEIIDDLTLQSVEEATP
jgi:hypothetical protein